MVRLKEIADELGVSVSMVSRVLTDKDRVDPEKRKLIKEALERHNYVPNEMARGLRGISSRSVALIVPTLSSNYYTRIITAAQEFAIENGYTVITCCSHHDAQRERDTVELLKNKQIDKVMCASVMPDAGEYYAKAFPGGYVVFFDYDKEPDENIGYIYFDARGAAARLAEHVCELGHRRILVLNHLHESMRVKGFARTFEKYGIFLPEKRIKNGLATAAMAYEACLAAFSDGEVRPTAILAANDFLAYSAIKAVRTMGFRVPEDISVACFDACDDTGILTPELTSVMQSTEKIGRLAAKMLVTQKCEHFMLDTELVIGTSCISIK